MNVVSRLLGISSEIPNNRRHQPARRSCGTKALSLNWPAHSHTLLSSERIGRWSDAVISYWSDVFVVTASNDLLLLSLPGLSLFTIRTIGRGCAVTSSLLPVFTSKRSWLVVVLGPFSITTPHDTISTLKTQIEHLKISQSPNKSNDGALCDLNKVYLINCVLLLFPP